MTKVLILAASLGLSISAAHACDFLRSAQSSGADKTVVASVTTADGAVPMSVPAEKPVLADNAAQQPAAQKAESRGRKLQVANSRPEDSGGLFECFLAGAHRAPDGVLAFSVHEADASGFDCSDASFSCVKPNRPSRVDGC